MSSFSYHQFDPDAPKASSISLTCSEYHETEEPAVSFCCCLYNQNGYVMASDSRSVTMGADGIKSFSDNCQKVIYLPNAKLGIVSAGQNSFDGKAMATLLKEMEPRLIGVTAEEAAKILAEAINVQHLVGSVNLCVAKAEADTPTESYFVDIKLKSGVGEITKNNGIWRNTPTTADVFEDLYVRTQADMKRAVAVPIDSMTLEEMAAFARHLIETYMAVYHFRSDLPPVVGGPVQLLCVDSFGNVCQ